MSSRQNRGQTWEQDVRATKEQVLRALSLVERVHEPGKVTVTHSMNQAVANQHGLRCEELHALAGFSEFDFSQASPLSCVLAWPAIRRLQP
jgi:hypothetical protein